MIAAALVAATNTPARTIVRSVQAAHASQLRLQAESGDVLLVAGNAHTIVIRAMAQGNAPTPGITITRAGSSVEITLSGHAIAGLPFAASAGGSIHYEIDYPSNLSVQAADLEGNVTVENTRARIAVETNSGSIVASNAYGELDLAADRGDVTATLAQNWRSASIRMQSTQGDLRLQVPRGFRAHVDASSDQGTVHNALPPMRAKTPFVWLYTARGDISIVTPGT